MDDIRVRTFHDNGTVSFPRDILSKYGDKTMAELDSEYDFNKYMGNMYSTGYLHMEFIMLQTDEEILQAFFRLPIGPCRDIFNIIASIIRYTDEKTYKWL